MHFCVPSNKFSHPFTGNKCRKLIMAPEMNRQSSPSSRLERNGTLTLNNLSLHQLLDICGDIQNPDWERGWRAFLKRYKLFIYKCVSKTCILWNVPRLDRQLSEAVNDVVSDVMILLCRDGCKVIKNFRARDNEKMFLSWLATICRRATSRYIQQHFKKNMLNESFESIQTYLGMLNFESKWELYEHLTSELRGLPKAKRKHLERDIHIFQLYIWGDFSPAMITAMPCLKNIGHRVIDNVVNRMRQYLKEYGTDMQ